MEPPAMSAQDVARNPNAAVRINCYECQRCLFAGDDVPAGGADAVYQAAGCLDDPRTCPGTTPDEPTDVPEPAPLPSIEDVMTPKSTPAQSLLTPSRLATEIGGIGALEQVINHLE